MDRTERITPVLALAFALSCAEEDLVCPDDFFADDVGNCLERPHGRSVPTPDDDVAPCLPPPSPADLIEPQRPHFGDAVLSSQVEVDGFCANWDGVDGNLTLGRREEPGQPVDPTNITDLSGLSCLSVVKGYMHTSFNGMLTDLTLPSLIWTRGSMSIVLNDGPQTMYFPLMISIGGDLSIQNNPRLASLSAPNLAHLGQNFFVVGNSSLPSADAYAILGHFCEGEIGGSADIVGNAD